MLRSLGWFRTDVSGLPIDPIFVGWCETNLHCVTPQKTTEFRQTTVEVYDLAFYAIENFTTFSISVCH